MEPAGLILTSFLRYWGCEVEVLGLQGVEKVVGKRDDFVMDALFYFEPVQRFEYRGDMFSFGCSSYCVSEFCNSWR